MYQHTFLDFDAAHNEESKTSLANQPSELWLTDSVRRRLCLEEARTGICSSERLDSDKIRQGQVRGLPQIY